MKLEIDITPEEYGRLVEILFAGMLALEELYPDYDKTMELESRILRQAHKFIREHMVFTAPELEGLYTVGGDVEERVTSVLFKNGWL